MNYSSYLPSISNKQWELIHNYHKLLLEWNQKINLISRKSVESTFEKHILPILPIIEIYKFHSQKSIIDIGTGGGIPGIILAILFQQISFTLIDSIHKKTVAVSDIANKLKLKNVVVICDRFENIKSTYNVCVGRGVSSFDNFLKLSKLNLTKNGIVLYWSGGNLENTDICLNKHIKIFDICKFFGNTTCEAKKLILFNCGNHYLNYTLYKKSVI